MIDNQQKPNVILITSHDLGRHLGCYGVPTVRSPHLDRLAEAGVICTRAFCTQAICSPSRASIYTGRYPHTNGVMGLTHSLFQWDLHPDEQHLATILKNAGYRTALVGLQHETSRPEDMGFDTMNTTLANRWADGVAEKCGELLHDFAAQPDTPFYLQVGFSEVHRAPGHDNHEWGPMPADSPETAVTVPPFLIDDANAQDEMRQLQGAIRALDNAIGEILQAVEACGCRENTIILFTADHGIPFPRAKASMYDPGLEIALLMRGPECLIRRGLSIDSLISNVDILPTLLALIELPISQKVQGKSFAAALRGEKYQPRKAIFAEMTYHTYPDPMRSVRTETHKLIVNFLPTAAIYNATQQRRPQTTSVQPANPTGALHPLIELYDLAHDPLERFNRAEDSAYDKIQTELLTTLSRWMRETDDPLLHGLPLPPRFHAATALLREISET